MTRAMNKPARAARWSHPAAFDESRLLKECDIDFGRTSGPGGQHRNKVETAVLITHKPTTLTGSASERRQQHQNRRVALFRLRMALARDVRVRTHPENHTPSQLWQERRQGRQMSVNPKHADYPALLAESLDVIAARRFDVAGAAGVLGVSMSQLAKLVRHDKRAFAAVNEERESRGMPRLK